MTFIKGKIPWNKGKKLHYKVWNKNTKGIMIAWNKGCKMPEGMRLKMMGNKNGLGHKKSFKIRKQISKSRLERKKLLGYINSPATREKMRLARLGKPSWNAGTATRNYKYPSKFNRYLKKEVKTRDNFICKLCGEIENLQVHHIDYDKNNCNLNNLITLCKNCNMKVNKNRNYWTQFFKEKVQRL
jgi:5-methylcytosine-specific restriction endonuclease McrA